MSSTSIPKRRTAKKKKNRAQIDAICSAASPLLAVPSTLRTAKSQCTPRGHRCRKTRRRPGRYRNASNRKQSSHDKRHGKTDMSQPFQACRITLLTRGHYQNPTKCSAKLAICPSAYWRPSHQTRQGGAHPRALSTNQPHRNSMGALRACTQTICSRQLIRARKGSHLPPLPKTHTGSTSARSTTSDARSQEKLGK